MALFNLRSYKPYMQRISFFLNKGTLLLALSLLSCSISFGQQKLVTIFGFAPTYIGKEISIYQIEDYYSDKEIRIGSGTVKSDSTFSVSFYIKETQRVTLRALNNYAWMYIEPNAQYEVLIPADNPYNATVKSGNQLEVSFFNLKPSDINYKILSFQRWTDEFLAYNLALKNSDPKSFAEKLDTFKMYVEKAYRVDSSIFFLTFVKFSMAELDEIEFKGSRNRFEKYDFYLKKSPIFYANDAYMHYIRNFYKSMIPRLSNEANNEVYLGVLKSSPTLIMKALGSDYTLKNLRLREMVMMQALSEVFYSDDFPQTNILTIFDSLSQRALFAENRIIATNLINRVTELVPGTKTPEFVLINEEGVAKTHADFRGQYLYIQFYDPKSLSNQNEMTILKDLHKKYINDVCFLTIVLDDGDLTPKEEKDIKEIQWEYYRRPARDEFMKTFKIKNYPNYILIDVSGYIVQSPALAPTPNAQYETIDRTFFQIQKMRRLEMERK
jgi:hypothetical protein